MRDQIMSHSVSSERTLPSFWISRQTYWVAFAVEPLKKNHNHLGSLKLLLPCEPPNFFARSILASYRSHQKTKGTLSSKKTFSAFKNTRLDGDRFIRTQINVILVAKIPQILHSLSEKCLFWKIHFGHFQSLEWLQTRNVSLQ